MELKGKKIAFLGDSITEMPSCPEERYVYHFENLSGATTYNFGICATRIATRLIPHETPSWNDSFLLRAERMKDDYDIIVVFGGTNDYARANPTPLGTIEDTDEHTFYGALKLLYTKLIKAHPHATVVAVTPLHRRAEKNYGLEGLELLDYVNAVREVASWYSIPVIDLWNTSGIQAQDEEVMNVYLKDGLHPNETGARRIADRIYNFLKSL